MQVPDLETSARVSLLHCSHAHPVGLVELMNLAVEAMPS